MQPLQLRVKVVPAPRVELRYSHSRAILYGAATHTKNTNATYSAPSLLVNPIHDMTTPHIQGSCDSKSRLNNMNMNYRIHRRMFS